MSAQVQLARFSLVLRDPTWERNFRGCQSRTREPLKTGYWTKMQLGAAVILPNRVALTIDELSLVSSDSGIPSHKPAPS